MIKKILSILLFGMATSLFADPIFIYRDFDVHVQQIQVQPEQEYVLNHGELVVEFVQKNDSVILTLPPYWGISWNDHEYSFNKKCTTQTYTIPRDHLGSRIIFYTDILGYPNVHSLHREYVANFSLDKRLGETDRKIVGEDFHVYAFELASFADNSNELDSQLDMAGFKENVNDSDSVIQTINLERGIIYNYAQLGKPYVQEKDSGLVIGLPYGWGISFNQDEFQIPHQQLFEEYFIPMHEITSDLILSTGSLHEANCVTRKLHTSYFENGMQGLQDCVDRFIGSLDDSRIYILRPSMFNVEKVPADTDAKKSVTPWSYWIKRGLVAAAILGIVEGGYYAYKNGQA